MSVAGSIWQLGETGDLVARDSSGNVVFGPQKRPPIGRPGLHVQVR